MKILIFYQNILLIFFFISCSVKPDNYPVGRTYELEMKEINDRKTKVPVKQLTNYKGHSHHFYFTNPGWYDHGAQLLFSSDRNNRTNLFSIDLKDYSIRQLTDLEPVPLPREVEFFRACTNPVNDQAFFWHDLELKSIEPLIPTKTVTTTNSFFVDLLLILQNAFPIDS
jgi:hypothetical protein